MINLIINESIKMYKKKRILIVLLFSIALCATAIVSEETKLREAGNFNPAAARAALEKRISTLQAQIAKQDPNDKTTTSFNETLLQLQQGLIDIDQRVELQKAVKNGTWKEVLSNRNKELESQLAKAEYRLEKENLRTQIAVNNFSIKHNTPPLTSGETNAFDMTFKVLWAIAHLLFPLLGILIGSDIVSGEYHPATIKLILTRPVSRWKMAVSKVVVAVITAFLAALFCIILVFLFGGLLHGFKGGSQPLGIGTRYVFAPLAEQAATSRLLAPVVGSTHLVTIFAFLLLAALYNCLVSITTAVIAFAISALIRQPLISLTVSLAAVAGGLFAAGQGMVRFFPGIVNPMSYADFIQIWTGRMAIGWSAAFINIPDALLLLGAWIVLSSVTGIVSCEKLKNMV